MPRAVYNEQTHDLVHIAGDPLAEQGPAAWAQSDYQLSKSKEAEVQVRYKDMVLFWDVYKIDGRIDIHAVCPKCHHYYWIRSDQKNIDWDGEKLSVERFICPWELGRGTDATENDRMAFGLGLCKLKLVVDGNIAREV